MESKKYTENLDSVYCRPEIRAYLSEMIKNIKLVTSLPNDSLCLDIGCGTGFVTHRLTCENLRAIGLDINKHSLVHGRKIGWIHESKIGSAYEIPFPDAKFDLVLLVDVIEHLDRPRLALKEARRVLKTGGFVALHTPHRLYSKLLRITWDSTHVHEFTFFELKRMLNECRFGTFYAYADLPLLLKRVPLVAHWISASLGIKAFYLNPFLYGPSFYIIGQKQG